MKKLLLIILVLGITLAIFADAYTIGTGTSTQSYIPFYGFYDYGWSKVIYTAAEMTTAGVPTDTEITGISFYVGNTPVNYVSEDQRVYVRHTSATEINTTYVADPLTETPAFTEVWVGDLTWNGTGWHNVLFTNTFTWNGTDNLEILWYNWDGAYASGPNFQYTATTTNLACYEYADGAMPTTDATATLNRPNIRILDAITSDPPGPVSALLTPANEATNVIQPTQFSWSAPTTGGIPTGYKLYIHAETNDFTGVTPIPVTGTSHAVTLDYSTLYYWKVAATNSAGDSPDSDVWSFTTMADPTQPLPYTQDFNSGTSLSAINWTGDMYIGNYHGNTSNVLYKNLYSYTTSTYAVSCPIGPMVANAELKFDYKYVDYSSPYPGTELSAGDNLQIQISTDDGATFATVHTIDQSNHVTSDAFATVTVELDAYSTGNIKVKFLATWGAGDYYLDIDNVIVREIPTGPIFSLSPDVTSWDFGMVPVNTATTQEFTVSNIGGGTLTLSSVATTGDYYSISVPPPVMVLGAGESTSFTVQYLPLMTGGPHTGQLVITDDRATTTVDLTGTAYEPATLPLTEDFESGWGDWVVVNGTQTNAWYIGTADPYEGTYSAYISNDDGTSNAYTIDATSVSHVYKDIAFDDNSLEFPLSFYWKCQGESSFDYLRVYLVETNVTPVAGTLLSTGQLAQLNQQGTWQNATITIPGTHSDTVKRLVFTWRNDSSVGTQPPINLDNISLTAVPEPTGPVLAPNLDYPADAQDDLPIGGFPFQFSWNTGGSQPDVYDLYLAAVSELPANYTEDDFFVAAVPYEDVTSPYTPAFTYEYGAHYVWTVTAYNAVYPDIVYQWPPYEFIIEPDPTITIPHTQAFGTDATPVWPANWTQTSTGSNVWTCTASANAGGTANEMTASWTSLVGTTRLITPPINTDGVSLFTASFNTYYNDFAAGITAKVQYSHDLATWYDTGFSITSGGGDVSGYKTVLISGLVDQPTTYVAWVLDGDHYQYDYWYVDDVALSLPPDHDVAPISWDVPFEVVPENTLVTPMATVINNGVTTETFDVTCAIGSYTSTTTVTDLALGQTQQVSFTPLTPALWSADLVEITTELTTDEVTQNDTLFAALICLDLDTPGLANNAQTDQFVQFNLADPGTLDVLPNGYTGSYFMSGADWMNGSWMAVEYDDGSLTTDNYYEIDPLTGIYAPSLGEPGAAIMGIAYDDTNDILYGVGGSDVTLYTMDTATGLATSVAVMWYDLDGTPTSLADIGGLMIACAYDNLNEILYGVDLGNDCLWVIDPLTAELTLIGFFGIDLNYAQDAAFDQENGLLFLAGYAGEGALYWVDTTYGGAYKVGPFGAAAYELDGFAIPYGILSIPDPAIDATGAMTWPEVTGAVHYKVLKATDPYGTYVPYATVYGTTWTDPLFAEDMGFYQIVAVGGRLSEEQAEVRFTEPLRKPGKIGGKNRVETGIAGMNK
jgi:hypothetical protein